MSAAWRRSASVLALAIAAFSALATGTLPAQSIDASARSESFTLTAAQRLHVGHFVIRVEPTLVPKRLEATLFVDANWRAPDRAPVDVRLVRDASGTEVQLGGPSSQGSSWGWDFEPFASCGPGPCDEAFTVTLTLRGTETLESTWGAAVHVDFDGSAPSSATATVTATDVVNSIEQKSDEASIVLTPAAPSVSARAHIRLEPGGPVASTGASIGFKTLYSGQKPPMVAVRRDGDGADLPVSTSSEYSGAQSTFVPFSSCGPGPCDAWFTITFTLADNDWLQATWSMTADAAWAGTVPAGATLELTDVPQAVFGWIQQQSVNIFAATPTHVVRLTLHAAPGALARDSRALIWFPGPFNRSRNVTVEVVRDADGSPMELERVDNPAAANGGWGLGFEAFRSCGPGPCDATFTIRFRLDGGTDFQSPWVPLLRVDGADGVAANAAATVEVETLPIGIGGARASTHIVLTPSAPTAVLHVSITIDPGGQTVGTMAALLFERGYTTAGTLISATVRRDSDRMGLPLTLAPPAETVPAGPPGTGWADVFEPVRSCGPAVCRVQVTVTIRLSSGTTSFDSDVDLTVSGTYPGPVPDTASASVTIGR